jgi:hypothetical protein
MDYCVEEFSDNFNTIIDKKETSIFIGALDENGKVQEEECNLEPEYTSCRIYLDIISRMNKLLILFYTKGTISKLLTSYTLNLIKFEYSISISSQKNNIYKTIIDFIKYRSKFDVINDDFYKEFFNGIISWIVINLNQCIESFLDILKEDYAEYEQDKYEYEYEDKYEYEEEKKLIRQQLKKIRRLQMIFNRIIDDTEKYKMIINLIINRTRKSKQYIINNFIYFLFDKYFDDDVDNTKKIKVKKYIETIDKDLNDIINNAPPINRCIRLFRAADNYKNYIINEIITINKITSTSCSQKTNISSFISSAQGGCCIAEFIIKPGTKALFLNYEETTYGEAMYEVILQKDLKFKVSNIEKKPVVSLNDIYMEIPNEDYEIKKISNIKYETPNKSSLRDINIYLLKQI